MNLFEEYALLVVPCAPALVVVVMNVWLAWNGERDTLLLPGANELPPINLAAGELLASKASTSASAAAEWALTEPVREAA